MQISRTIVTIPSRRAFAEVTTLSVITTWTVETSSQFNTYNKCGNVLPKQVSALV